MSLPTSTDPIRASDPAAPAPAPEAAPPARIQPDAPQEFSVGAPARPVWAAAPRIDYSRAYAAPPAYAPPGGYAQPPSYAPPPGYPQGGYAPDGGDPRAAAYFDRMHAARAPPGEDGEEEDEDEDEVSDDEASRASTKDSKKRAARAALASKEKAQRLAREKHVLTQLMLAAPEGALDTLFQAPNVQAAVQEFVQGRLDIDKLERDLVVIDCVRRVKGQHAANRALDDQAPDIAGGIWKLAGLGAELGGVVPPGSWDLARNEWAAESENARKVQRDWVRTLLSILGAGSGGGGGTAMVVSQALALATPIVAIGATARAMAPPPAIAPPPAGYNYAPPPAPATAPAQSFSVPAPAAPPQSFSLPAPAEPVRSTSVVGSAFDPPAAPAEEPARPPRPPTPTPPPITTSYATARPVTARSDDVLGDLAL